LIVANIAAEASSTVPTPTSISSAETLGEITKLAGICVYLSS
jgi:hypothetical protein